MTHTDSAPQCPSLRQLTDWFDGVLDARTAERIEDHLDGCERCRLVLLDWSEPVTALPAASTAGTGDCLDGELLTAYSVAAATLAPGAVTGIERHLRTCTHCVGALQRVMHAHRGLEEATLSTTPATVTEPVRASAPRLAGHGPGTVAPWLEAVRALLTPALWPRAAWAAVGVLVLAIGLTRFVGPVANNEPSRVRGDTRATAIEVIVETPAHARPSRDEPVVAQLAPGTRARWLEQSGEWTRLELADGRRVWVPSRAVAAGREE